MSGRHVSGIPLAVSATTVVAVVVAGVKTTVVMLTATAYFIAGTSFYSAAPRPAPTVEQAQQAMHGYTDKTITASEVNQGSSTIWPVSGLNAPTMGQSLRDGEAKLDNDLKADPNEDHVVMAFSLGAATVSYWELRHANGADPSAPAANKLEFILIGSPSRPNGGILARFPGLYIPLFDIRFIGATPQTEYKTTDVVKQYDGIGDFPKYPLNLIALANAFAGYLTLHPDYSNVDPNSPDNDVQVVGNTTYITVPTEHLPLLEPFRAAARLLGIKRTPLLDAIEPALKVLVELGYDRENYGQATSAQLLPPVSRLVAAVPQFVDAVRQGVMSLTKPAAAAVPPVATSAVDPSTTTRQQSQGQPKQDLPRVSNTAAVDASPAHEVTKPDLQPSSDAAPADSSKPKQGLKLPKLQLPKLPPFKLPKPFAPKSGSKSVQDVSSGNGTDKPVAPAASAPKHEAAGHTSNDNSKKSSD